MRTALEESRTLAKEYDFRTMTDLAEFTTSYMWPREKIINDESQFYVNPAKVSFSHNPLQLSESGLSIFAKATPEDLTDYALALTDAGRKIGLANFTPEDYAAHAKVQPFISGLVTSRDNGYSQLFGYWEMSAMLPSAIGAWPAFWLLPTFEQWPSGIPVLPEIDIMEATAKVKDGIYHGSLHTNETGKMVHSDGNDIHASADLTNEYHRYGLSWEPDFIVWYFDGVEVIRRKTPEDMLFEPRHFLLNFAVGGWGGDPVITDYPDAFNIEYVRIYASSYVEPEQKESSLQGDVIRVLEDGRAYTKRDAELSASYMLEISQEQNHANS